MVDTATKNVVLNQFNQEWSERAKKKTKKIRSRKFMRLADRPQIELKVHSNFLRLYFQPFSSTDSEARTSDFN